MTSTHRELSLIFKFLETIISSETRQLRVFLGKVGKIFRAAVSIIALKIVTSNLIYSKVVPFLKPLLDKGWKNRTKQNKKRKQKKKKKRKEKSTSESNHGEFWQSLNQVKSSLRRTWTTAKPRWSHLSLDFEFRQSYWELFALKKNCEADQGASGNMSYHAK